MIDKKKFKETITFIKKQRKFEDKLYKLLASDVSVYGEYEDKLVELIKDDLNIPKEDETLEFWLYELDFGKDYSVGCICEENGKAIDLSSMSKLYDYLITIGEKYERN